MSRAGLMLLSGLLLFCGGYAARAALMAPAPPVAGVPREIAPGMLLVASRTFHDPYFSAAVVYLLQHDSQGTVGVIINHPTSIRLTEWLPELAGTALESQMLYDGGPVYPDLLAVVMENRGWRGEDAGATLRHVQGDVLASFDPAVLERMQQQGGAPARVRCYSGHIGWYPGQLEQELGHHYWHLLPGDVDEVFGANAGSLWQRLIERLEPAESLPSPSISRRP